MQIHVVSPGETLQSIAQAYGLSATYLARINALPNPEQLIVGQDIVILYPALLYTVAAGDTLTGIAARYGIPVLQLLRNNPELSDRAYLYTGETLIISFVDQSTEPEFPATAFPNAPATLPLIPQNAVPASQTAPTNDAAAMTQSAPTSGTSPMTQSAPASGISSMTQSASANDASISASSLPPDDTTPFYPQETDREAAYSPAQVRSMPIAVIGYAYPYIDRDVLRKTLPYLTYLTLFTYGFQPDGSLIDIDDEEVISIARSFGVAPILLISTLTSEGTFSNALAHDLLINPTAQNTLIDNLITVMQQRQYYGLDIDFEFVPEDDRAAYVGFIELLTARCNAAGFPVLAALAPKVSATQRGLLYEAHDYPGIGAAANAVLLMTYEWGYTYGPPMAVSPIDKVREVLDYAVTEIPRDKIFMGMPNYGYDWPLPFIRGSSKAQSMGNVAALEQAVNYGASIQYDETAQAPFYYYTDDEGNPHVVWFENARSVNAKIRLIPEYGFRGPGYWNVMRFFPQNWLVVNALFRIVTVLPTDL